MDTLLTIITIIVSAGAILGGMLRMATALYRAGSQAQQLKAAVADNTAATSRLSADFELVNQATRARLDNHETRITTLERER